MSDILHALHKMEMRLIECKMNYNKKIIINTLTETVKQLEKKIDKISEGEQDKHILKKVDQANERELKLEQLNKLSREYKLLT